jgi:hypothetical protein
MEDNLSKLLNQIKICDTFDIDDDDSPITLASYYHQVLNNILSNLTSKFKSIDEIESLFHRNNFSNLQLTIQE